MRIPGLNAPIPEGAQWGFHPGGWGRPPIDEKGQPIYGDVFGENKQEHQDLFELDIPQRELWGEIAVDEIMMKTVTKMRSKMRMKKAPTKIWMKTKMKTSQR